MTNKTLIITDKLSTMKNDNITKTEFGSSNEFEVEIDNTKCKKNNYA